MRLPYICFFFFNDTATTEIYTLSLHERSSDLILDADGLNAFAGRGQDLVKRKTKHLALTPHPGEMARLLGLSSATVQADRLAIAWKAAKAWKAHIILKDRKSVV